MFAVTFKQRQLNGKYYIRCISSIVRRVQGFDDIFKFTQKTANYEMIEFKFIRRHSSDTNSMEFKSCECRKVNDFSERIGVNSPVCDANQRHVSLPDLNVINAKHNDISAMITVNSDYKGHLSQLNGQLSGQLNSIRRYSASNMSQKSEDKTETAVEINKEAPKLTTRLKLAIRDYGATVIVFHVTISLLSFIICYLIVYFGVPVQKVIESLSFAQSFIEKASTGSTLLVSYILYKCFSPLRMACTLFCAPPLVRYLRRKGVLTATKKIPETIKKRDL